MFGSVIPSVFPQLTLSLTSHSMYLLQFHTYSEFLDVVALLVFVQKPLTVSFFACTSTNHYLLLFLFVIQNWIISRGSSKTHVLKNQPGV